MQLELYLLMYLKQNKFIKSKLTGKEQKTTFSFISIVPPNGHEMLKKKERIFTKCNLKLKKMCHLFTSEKCFFYPPPNVNKCRKKRVDFFFCLNFVFFTAEFSHFLITNFGGEILSPKICDQKLTPQ